MISSLLHLVGLQPRVYYTLTNFRGGGKAPLAPPLNTPMQIVHVFQHCHTLPINLQKLLYNSQTSIGGRQYTIILFISIIFLPTILIYLNDKERGRHIIFCRILAPPQCPPHSPDATILIHLNDREGAPLFFVEF